MRIYFYLLSGAISALCGWLFSRLILDLFSWSQQLNSIIVIESMTIFIVTGTIINECLVINARRPKLILNILKRLLIISLTSSILISSTIGIVLQFLLPNNISENSIFFLLSLGLSIGIAKGLSFRLYPDKGYFRSEIILKKYIFINILAGSFTGLSIAIIFQLFSETYDNLYGFNPLINFILLGIVYSIILSFYFSPYYQPALRAGEGFEYIGEIYDDDLYSRIKFYPIINKPRLGFVSTSWRGWQEEIEEGLSIAFPRRGNIIIGSHKNEKADISIPNIPLIVAHIQLKNCQTLLFPSPEAFQFIEINGETLESASKPISLDHNYELAFYTLDKKKVYKFAFYNRFLDPRA